MLNSAVNPAYPHAIYRRKISTYFTFMSMEARSRWERWFLCSLFPWWFLEPPFHRTCQLNVLSSTRNCCDPRVGVTLVLFLWCRRDADFLRSSRPNCSGIVLMIIILFIQRSVHLPVFLWPSFSYCFLLPDLYGVSFASADNFVVSRLPRLGYLTTLKIHINIFCHSKRFFT